MPLVTVEPPLFLLEIVQGKYDDADRLYMRAISISEKLMGPDHPAVAEHLNEQAQLLLVQVRKLKCLETDTIGS